MPSAPAVTDNGTTATPPETGAPSPSDIPAGETGAPNPEDLNTGSDATKTEEATEQIEFTKKVLPSEKIHYENVIAANKKTIAALRTENIGLRNEIKALTEGPEASEE